MNTETTKEYNVVGVKITEGTKIKFVPNPKRVNSAAHARYEKYQSCKTFGEYLKKNEGKFAMADARHDLTHKFLQIEAGK